MPTVTFVSASFEDLARLECSTQEIPALPVVVVPHPFGTLAADPVYAHVDARWEQVLRAITGGPRAQG